MSVRKIPWISVGCAVLIGLTNPALAQERNQPEKIKSRSRQCLKVPLTGSLNGQWADVCYMETTDSLVALPAQEIPVLPGKISVISQNQFRQNLPSSAHSARNSVSARTPLPKKTLHVSFNEEGILSVEGGTAAVWETNGQDDQKSEMIPWESGLIEPASGRNGYDTPLILQSEIARQEEQEYRDSFFNIPGSYRFEAARQRQKHPLKYFFDDIDTEWSVVAGYREDNLDWNIADSDSDPDVLSELIWRDIEMFQVKAQGTAIINQQFVIDGWVSTANILDGTNQDSDFASSGRNDEFLRSVSTTEDEDAFDYSGSLGYRMDIPRGWDFFEVDKLWLTLFAGYSFHELEFIDRQGIQIIPPTGAFDNQGINAVYQAEWDGPWIGFQLQGAKRQLGGRIRFEYHFADYSAEADWPLRDDLQHPKSFEHDADGYGVVFNLGLDYMINDDWSISLHGDIQRWKAEDGIDRTFGSDGSVAETRLNEVNWESYAVMLGATYHFM